MTDDIAETLMRFEEYLAAHGLKASTCSNMCYWVGRVLRAPNGPEVYLTALRRASPSSNAKTQSALDWYGRFAGPSALGGAGALASIPRPIQVAIAYCLRGLWAKPADAKGFFWGNITPKLLSITDHRHGGERSVWPKWLDQAFALGRWLFNAEGAPANAPIFCLGPGKREPMPPKMLARILDAIPETETPTQADQQAWEASVVESLRAKKAAEAAVCGETLIVQEDRSGRAEGEAVSPLAALARMRAKVKAARETATDTAPANVAPPPSTPTVDAPIPYVPSLPEPPPDDDVFTF